jgi:hypothetical protein
MPKEPLEVPNEEIRTRPATMAGDRDRDPDPEHDCDPDRKTRSILAPASPSLRMQQGMLCSLGRTGDGFA